MLRTPLAKPTPRNATLQAESAVANSDPVFGSVLRDKFAITILEPGLSGAASDPANGRADETERAAMHPLSVVFALPHRTLV
jgi:hypothetical protein